MNIHHATVKSAAAKGVTLSIVDDNVQARHNDTGVVVAYEIEDEEGTNERAKDAWVAAQTIVDFTSETACRIVQADGDFVAYATKGEKEEIARDPELEDLLETIREHFAGTDADEGDEDEATGSVVPDKYKQKYAAEGHAGHCGDWLALELNRLCIVKDEAGKQVTDLDRLETIANANGVAPDRVDKLGTETRGWQGRYRMTVRNMLTKVVAAKGFMLVPEGCGVDADTELKAPKAWCELKSPKPKAKAPAPQAAVTKNPGQGKASAKTKAKKAK
jgi:hypothetical protein